jgi:hypothetical protein
MKLSLMKFEMVTRWNAGYVRLGTVFKSASH